MNFANPFLLWGSLLFTVPLLIHLLNKRRYQRVPWAAMKFLLAAHKTNRRRLRMENLLLLLARCLAVILLAFTVARPFFAAENPLTIVEKRKDYLLVLDASYSMGLKELGGSSFQRGVEEGLALLEQLKPARGDRASVILAKKDPVLLSDRDPAKAREQLRSLEKPSFESNDFALTLEWIRRAVESFGEEGEISIFWICDLQKNSFLQTAEEENKKNEKLESLFSALADRGVRLQCIDVGVGSQKPSNLAITSLFLDEMEPEFAGAPLYLRARVRNFGTQEQSSIPVQFFVDDVIFQTETLDLAGGEEKEIFVMTSFAQAGSHSIQAKMSQDSLSADDQRALALWVRPPARLLFVDGDPSQETFLSETGALRTLLQPEDSLETKSEIRSPFQIETIDRSRFFANPQSIFDYDLVLLANIDGFSPEAVEKLEGFVTTGKSLLFTLGDRVEPADYNARLRRNTAENLLPGSLLARKAVASRRQEYYRIAYPNLDHPALRFFQDEKWKPLLTEIPVYEFIQISADPSSSGTRILASLDDPDRSPLLLEKPFGRGRVGWFSSSLDSAWNQISESPKTFYPLFFEWLRLLTSPPSKTRNWEIGKSLDLETSRFPRRASWMDPNGKRFPIDQAPKLLGSNEYLFSSVTRMNEPGIYTVEMESAQEGEIRKEIVHFAANVDSRESDLERIPREAFSAFFPGVRTEERERQQTISDKTPATASMGEIWPNLLIAALGLLVLESAMAFWFGRRRVLKSKVSS